MSNKYRFDDAYEKVYELRELGYHFIGTYFAYGIDKNMSDAEKTAIVDLDQYESFMQEQEPRPWKKKPRSN